METGMGRKRKNCRPRKDWMEMKEEMDANRGKNLKTWRLWHEAEVNGRDGERKREI